MSVISAATFRDQLDLWGVNYIEHERHDRCAGRVVSWEAHEVRTSSRCRSKGTWDAHGIAMHHSGGPTSWRYIWDGEISSARVVPGPLYIVLIYEDGVAHLCGWETTNNVGMCDRTVYERVLRGDMPTSGSEVSPGPDDYGAANLHFYGISYRGTTPNTAQRRTARLICAAICTGHTRATGFEWDGGSIAGHKELTQRKPDPDGEDMTEFRAEVNQLLEVGPARLAKNIVTIGGIDFGSGTDFDIEERDMAIDRNDVKTIAKTDGIFRGPPSNPNIEDNPTWQLDSLIMYAVEYSMYKGAERIVTKPYWPDETIAVWNAIRWNHSRLRKIEPLIEKMAEQQQALLDSQLGADADEVKALINRRADAAAAEREALADKISELQGQLDPAALAEQLATMLPAVSQEDLEAALRNVLGSLDNA